MPIAVAFGAIARIAREVPVPVTADVEAGYNLGADELVAALLAAGAVGCNLEDTDHRRPGHLVDVDVAAARLAAVREAARQAGVELVINARIDVLIHAGTDRPTALAEVGRRAHRYLEAGADCVFPLGIADPVTVEGLVADLGAPVNVGLPPGVTVGQMAAAGASHRRSAAPAAGRWRTCRSGPASCSGRRRRRPDRAARSSARSA